MHTAKTVERPLSVRDMFSIGIGPSSSHTVGPMRAAHAFSCELEALSATSAPVRSLRVELFGSLAATGKGHSTDTACLLGLTGARPETVTVEQIQATVALIQETHQLSLPHHRLDFNPDTDIVFSPLVRADYHVNALTITAYGDENKTLLQRTYYSVGGGFVMVERSQTDARRAPGEVEPLPCEEENACPPGEHATPAPYPFTTAQELLAITTRTGLSIAEVVRANEESYQSREALNSYLDLIAATMSECIRQGCTATGVLPGVLGVKRRARRLHEELRERDGQPARGTNWIASLSDPMRAMDWVNLWALAVNEENASGHRIVTAPTNGAAGVIPAVLRYLLTFCPCEPNPVEATRNFLLTATAIGALIKTNASIAGAEVGCQGEVGSASSMAAAGLAAALGASPQQVENAAEIAMEHHLGLTCDPVAGLVQIPCIERNAIASNTAINAARMALWNDGEHAVSLDTVIKTMRETGHDMLDKYKETSLGGLASNVVEC